MYKSNRRQLLQLPDNFNLFVERKHNSTSLCYFFVFFVFSSFLFVLKCQFWTRADASKKNYSVCSEKEKRHNVLVFSTTVCCLLVAVTVAGSWSCFQATELKDTFSLRLNPTQARRSLIPAQTKDYFCFSEKLRFRPSFLPLGLGLITPLTMSFGCPGCWEDSRRFEEWWWIKDAWFLNW